MKNNLSAATRHKDKQTGSISTPLPVRLLFVDDDEDDYLLFQGALSHIDRFPVDLTWADTYDKAVEMINRETFDIFFVDYRLVQHTGLELLKYSRESGHLQPFIILTGHGDYNVDVEAMQAGAADYLEKDLLSPPMLERVIRYAISRANNLNTLQRSEKILKALSKKLFRAQEDERKRISKELHDSTSSNLTALKYAIEKKLYEAENDPDGTDAHYFRYLVDLIRETIADVQRIYSDLHPGLIEELGLLSAVNKFCRGFGKIHDRITLSLELTIDEPDIPQKLKIVIYRVMQEALNNVAKHSECDRVHLSLEQTDDGEIRMVVADNGKGFDVDGTITHQMEGDSGGFGIINMKERVLFSRGSFSLQSQPGSGATLTITWPGEE